jgi:hypothetical protein
MRSKIGFDGILEVRDRGFRPSIFKVQRASQKFSQSSPVFLRGRWRGASSAP